MDINDVLVFRLKGKFAHFKNFYSNKSSLTYKIPPRTVLMGMVASILGYSRDTYYKDFNIDNAKFGLKVINPGKSHFECMNYLKEDGAHTQIRLQLLSSIKDSIEYEVYFTHYDKNIINYLEKKLIENQFGYGLYFGQRQFRVTAIFKERIKKDKITIINNYSDTISTVTFKENIISLNLDDNCKIIVDNIPISFVKVGDGREITKMAKILFEESGKLISGVFKEALDIQKDKISFYTPLGVENK
ncbi:MAG: CRISPR-associated protein Cas5 [bacterium]